AQPLHAVSTARLVPWSRGRSGPDDLAPCLGRAVAGHLAVERSDPEPELSKRGPVWASGVPVQAPAEGFDPRQEAVDGVAVGDTLDDGGVGRQGPRLTRDLAPCPFSILRMHERSSTRTCWSGSPGRCQAQFTERSKKGSHARALPGLTNPLWRVSG